MLWVGFWKSVSERYLHPKAKLRLENFNRPVLWDSACWRLEKSSPEPLLKLKKGGEQGETFYWQKKSLCLVFPIFLTALCMCSYSLLCCRFDFELLFGGACAIYCVSWCYFPESMYNLPIKKNEIYCKWMAGWESLSSQAVKNEGFRVLALETELLNTNKKTCRPLINATQEAKQLRWEWLLKRT